MELFETHRCFESHTSLLLGVIMFVFRERTATMSLLFRNSLRRFLHLWLEFGLQIPYFPSVRCVARFWRPRPLRGTEKKFIHVGTRRLRFEAWRGHPQRASYSKNTWKTIVVKGLAGRGSGWGPGGWATPSSRRDVSCRYHSWGF